MKLGLAMALCVMALSACDSKFWSTEKTEVKTQEQEKAAETTEGGKEHQPQEEGTQEEGAIKKDGDPSAFHSGYDINGKETTCPMLTKDIACTMVFTPGDQYAADCQKAGGKAMMCECHVYLCSKKL